MEPVLGIAAFRACQNSSGNFERFLEPPVCFPPGPLHRLYCALRCLQTMDCVSRGATRTPTPPNPRKFSGLGGNGLFSSVSVSSGYGEPVAACEALRNSEAFGSYIFIYSPVQWDCRED